MEDAARQSDQRFELSGEADAVELADIDEFERVAGLRHQAGFHSPGRAEKADFRCVGGLECTGYRQGGNHVAAGAAAGNHDPHARQSISRVRLSSTPMLARVMNRDVPP